MGKKWFWHTGRDRAQLRRSCWRPCGWRQPCCPWRGWWGWRGGWGPWTGWWGSVVRPVGTVWPSHGIPKSGTNQHTHTPPDLPNQPTWICKHSSVFLTIPNNFWQTPDLKNIFTRLTVFVHGAQSFHIMKCTNSYLNEILKTKFILRLDVTGCNNTPTAANWWWALIPGDDGAHGNGLFLTSGTDLKKSPLTLQYDLRTLLMQYKEVVRELHPTYCNFWTPQVKLGPSC